MSLSACIVLLSAALFAAPVEPWKPAGISSPKFESHAAFDPRTGDLYFVRSAADFTGWRIVVSRCGARGWSEPREAEFAGDGSEADPWFTPDGAALYFISNRSTDGVRKKDLDFWRVDRSESGVWGTPVRLPQPVNSAATEWFPRLAPDGWLYFGSNRRGGLGGNDVWRARPEGTGWKVENLGPAINSAGNEYEPLISPDGSRMILMADDDLFESRRRDDGSWSPRVRLPPEVNSGAMEVGAAFSPSGRSLLFARDTKGPDSGEFFVYREDGVVEAWPPACPK